MSCTKISGAVDLGFDRTGDLEPLVVQRGLHNIPPPPPQADDCSVDHWEISDEVGRRRIASLTAALSPLGPFRAMAARNRPAWVISKPTTGTFAPIRRSDSAVPIRPSPIVPTGPFTCMISSPFPV